MNNKVAIVLQDNIVHRNRFKWCAVEKLTSTGAARTREKRAHTMRNFPPYIQNRHIRIHANGDATLRSLRNETTKFRSHSSHYQ